jgi:serine/threonine protein kinase
MEQSIGANRFTLVRTLGAGGMGVVYEANDRERGLTVALKTLKKLSPQSLSLFKNEFRALADLHHPNLIQLYELISDDGQWFFTMEMIGGCDLLSFVRGSADTTLPDSSATANTLEGEAAPFEQTRLRAAMHQLALGISALHATGKVHRDIKPSNIMVEERPSTDSGHTSADSFRVVLMDFGLITEADAAQAQVVGTPLYMAPEQAAGQPAGTAADWYAVGVILYQCLTGAPPFTGSTPQVLLAKQHRDPAPISSPTDLADLAMALLARDPASRPSEKEIFAKLGHAPHSSEPSLSVSFIGRSAEVSTLAESFEASRRSAVTVLVRGESGVGKSALVRHFVEPIAHNGEALVLSGRCYEREQVPYKALDGIIDALARFLSRIDQVDAALLLPRDAPLLAQIFPVLGKVDALARLSALRQESPEPIQRRTRAFAALRELFTRLAERPLILCIDDLQWTDADSLALLSEVLTPPAPPLLLIATIRGGAALPNLPGEPKVIELSTLSTQDALNLVHSLNKKLSDTEALALATEAKGHPLFLQELTRYAAISEETQAAKLDDILWRRVESCEESERRLLEAAAVAGAMVPNGAMRVVAGLEPSVYAAKVSSLRAAQLLRSSGVRDVDAVEPYHDRVREAIVARLSTDEQRGYHRRLGDALEASGLANPHDLVRHLEAAGEGLRAAMQAEKAAKRAVSMLAFDRAAEFFQVALRLGTYDSAARRALLMSLGEALASARRGPEAADAFLLAAEGQDEQGQLLCRRQAAEHLIGSGHVERGEEVVNTVLATFGERLPITLRRGMLSLIWNLIKVKLRGLRWRPRTASEIPPRELMRFDFFLFIGIFLGFSNPIFGGLFITRSLLLALRLGEPGRMARALAIEVSYVSQLDDGLPRARRCLAEAHRIAATLNDPELPLYNNSVQALLSFYEGSLLNTLTQTREVEKELMQLAAFPWNLNAIRIYRLFALLLHGAWAELGRALDEYLQDAYRRDDRYIQIAFPRIFNIAWLVRDDPTGARRALSPESGPTTKRGNDHFAIEHFAGLLSYAQIDLYEDGSKPLSYQSIPKRSPIFRNHVLRVMALSIRGRLALAEGGSSLTEAKRLARLLIKERSPYGPALGFLLEAGLCATRGDQDAAIAALREAAARAEAMSMCMYVATARYRLGQLLGGPEGAAMNEEAERSMRAEGVKNPTRMIEMLAPGFTLRV